MKRTTTFMAAMVFIAIHAEAAIIDWGTPTWIVGDTDVSTEGTLHASINPAGNPETINGVTFNASDANLDVNGAAATDFIDGTLLSDLVPATGSYSNALETGEYQVSEITINSLAIGQEYLVQVWSSDAREDTTAGVPGRRTDLADTGAFGNATTLQENHNHDNTASTFGQWVTGTFVADAASQTIFVRGLDSKGACPDCALINLAQVRAVPEAASVTMIVLSAGLFLAANRFMRE